MTFLASAQKASLRLIAKKPMQFFASTNTFEQEICDLSSEVCEDIVKRKDWRKLTVLKELTGDGVIQGFDLPDDWDHMPKGMMIHQKDWWGWNFVQVSDLSDWLTLLNGAVEVTPGTWIVLDGQTQFIPALPDGNVAQYYYISKNIVQNGLTRQSAFTADDQSLVLDETLLTLGLIWMWKAQKGMAYQQDFDNYETRLDEISGQEKGSQVQVVTDGRWRGNYPFRSGFGWGW